MARPRWSFDALMSRSLHPSPLHYAQPRQFWALARLLEPLGWLMAALCIAGGVTLMLLAPPDYRQGEAVRLLFLHVPNAWMALLVYSAIAAASAWGLVFRHALAHVFARAALLPGAAFTLITLLTGALWGKPVWGVFWVWDARLTSVLVLLLLYLGLMALWEALGDPQTAAKPAAILAVAGFVNVPIVKFSVDWWNTLHQPASLSRLAAPALHSEFLWPLVLMVCGWMALFVALICLRMRTALLERALARREAA